MAKAHDEKARETTADDATLPKGETADELHGLTTALKGDLTKLAGTKADKAIAHWEGLLEKLGPGVKGIHGDLGKLREHVSKSDVDGKAVARLLHGLSGKVTKVAEETGGVVGTALKSLAGALEKGGASLGEADDASSAKTHATKK